MIEETNDVEGGCKAERGREIIDGGTNQHHAILLPIITILKKALLLQNYEWWRFSKKWQIQMFFRKFSGGIVAAFKACNLGCLGRLSSRPACPWGCTPTNRLYCRDMT